MGAYLKGGYAKSEELHISGISVKSCASFVAGRLLIWDKSSLCNTDEASILCILDGKNPPPPIESAPAALVISSCALSNALLSFAVSAAIPFMIVHQAPQNLKAYRMSRINCSRGNNRRLFLPLG